MSVEIKTLEQQEKMRIAGKLASEGHRRIQFERLPDRGQSGAGGCE